jgi:RNA polymerase sigma-70 factor (ECF subfamily)
MAPDPPTTSQVGKPVNLQSEPSPTWWDVLLRDGESSSQAVIEALRLFVRRAIRRSISGRRGYDSAFIEDVTQEATVRVLKSLHTFRGDSQFTTWATTVAVRVAFTELRQARWKEVSLNQLLGAEDGKSGSRYEPASNEDAANRDGARDELLSSLRQVMDRVLTERQLTAIAAELAGMPLPQLSEKLQTNPNALYKLLHDARKKLKQGLADIGITEQDVRSALDE